MLAGGALSGLLNGKERESARFDGDRGGDLDSWF